MKQFCVKFQGMDLRTSASILATPVELDMGVTMPNGPLDAANGHFGTVIVVNGKVSDFRIRLRPRDYHMINDVLDENILTDEEMERTDLTDLFVKYTYAQIDSTPLTMNVEIAFNARVALFRESSEYDHPLASFAMKSCTFSYDRRIDESWLLSLNEMRMDLLDERAESKGYFHRHLILSDPREEQQPAFKLAITNEHNVRIDLDSFESIVMLDLAMEVLDFLLDMNSADSKPSQPLKSTRKRPSSRRLSVSSAKDTKIEAWSGEFFMTRIRLHLMEDLTKKAARSVVASGDIAVTWNQEITDVEVEKWKGSLSDFEMYVSSNSKSGNQIVEPCKFTFSYECTQKMHDDRSAEKITWSHLKLEQMEVFVSLCDIELMKLCIESMSEVKGDKLEKGIERRRSRRSSLLVDDAGWVDVILPSPAGRLEEKDDIAQSCKDSFALEARTILVTLINDIGGRDLPLVLATLSTLSAHVNVSTESESVIWADLHSWFYYSDVPLANKMLSAPSTAFPDIDKTDVEFSIIIPCIEMTLSTSGDYGINNCDTVLGKVE